MNVCNIHHIKLQLNLSSHLKYKLKMCSKLGYVKILLNKQKQFFVVYFFVFIQIDAKYS